MGSAPRHCGGAARSGAHDPIDQIFLWIQEWTAYASDEVVPTDDEIIKAYSAITGYDPLTGVNDNGAVEIDVLNHWRRTGIAGRTIRAYVAVEPGNHDHVKDAVELFGNCYIGVGLPISAQRQRVWSVPPGGPVGDGEPWSWAVTPCRWSATPRAP